MHRLLATAFSAAWFELPNLQDADTQNLLHRQRTGHGIEVSRNSPGHNPTTSRNPVGIIQSSAASAMLVRNGALAEARAKSRQSVFHKDLLSR